jgi:hypothetical protein
LVSTLSAAPATGGQGLIPKKTYQDSKRFSRTSFSSSRLLASFNFSGAEYTDTAADAESYSLSSGNLHFSGFINLFVCR